MKVDNSFESQNKEELSTSPCLWCGETAISKTKQKGYKEPDLFDIFYCQSCNTSFSMPRVNSDGVYELIYQNAQNVRGYSRYLKYQNEVIKQSNPLKFIANSEPSYWGPVYALQHILMTDKKARILEVGSGLGYLTYSLKNDGYNVQGLEISKEAVNGAKEKYGDLYICDDLYNFAEKNIESYDVVIMTEVIEHLSDPKEFIQSIKKLLIQQGVCIFTTPNKSFYPKDVAWYSDAPPVHCWWFSEDSIKYIADLYKMELKFIDFAKYYKKFPQLYKIKDIESEGQSVFDCHGNLIVHDIDKKIKLRTPKWIKRIRIYNLLKDFLIQKINVNIYKKGDMQSNVICAILTKR